MIILTGACQFVTHPQRFLYKPEVYWYNISNAYRFDSALRQIVIWRGAPKAPSARELAAKRTEGESVGRSPALHTIPHQKIRGSLPQSAFG